MEPLPLSLPHSSQQSPGTWVWVPLSSSDTSTGTSPVTDSSPCAIAPDPILWGLSQSESQAFIDHTLIPLDSVTDLTLPAENIDLFATADPGWLMDDLIEGLLPQQPEPLDFQWTGITGEPFMPFSTVGELMWNDDYSAPPSLSQWCDVHPPYVDGLPPPTTSSSSPSPSATEQGIFCHTCSRLFTTLNKLRKHQRTHTRPFVCNVCHKAHAAKKDLQRHFWTTHPDHAMANDIPSPVRKCGINGCTFEGRQDNLKRHIRTKHKTT